MEVSQIGVPQIIQNETILVLKPMVLGIPHFKKPCMYAVCIYVYYIYIYITVYCLHAAHSWVCIAPGTWSMNDMGSYPIGNRNE